MSEHVPLTGLVLSGGGARAAYQVGVLKAVAQVRREVGAGGRGNPFPVIAGTSAGAINAAALACGADDFDGTVAAICAVWENFRAEQVYRSDSIGVIRTGASWLTMMSIGWVIARWRRARPRSLLNNAPLEKLLGQLVSTARLRKVMQDGHLHALAVTASSYGSGLHVTFYDALVDIVPWTRSQRLAVRAPITIGHLLASSAIPFVFPAVALDIDGQREYCGDGSMRQAAPISPAVHLGAQRILVVGAGRMHEPPGERPLSHEYPNVAQIAGHALSNIFLDALAVDIERLRRINATLALLPPHLRSQTNLKPIEVLVIAPSERLDDIAAKHIGSLPLPIRAMLRGVGVSGKGEAARGGALASYLLFEAPYTRELMALGVRDTLARRDEVAAFFGWAAPASPPP
jgi:NTE family protein